MNYVRAVEALLGFYQDSGEIKQRYRETCESSGLDFESVRELMNETRNRWAVAHVTDKGRETDKLKEPPDGTLVLRCHDTCRKVIDYFLRQSPRATDAELNAKYGPLYYSYKFGQSRMPVATLWDDRGAGFGSGNLPSPNAVLALVPELVDRGPNVGTG